MTSFKNTGDTKHDATRPNKQPVDGDCSAAGGCDCRRSRIPLTSDRLQVP